jgi:uncharacterized protein YgiM (DUF1202 family)
LLISALAVAEPATLLRDTELRSDPQSTATVVQSLKSKSSVDITARKGAWAQVTLASGKTGWVRLLNLRTGSGQKGEGGLGALASVFKTGSSGNTVSTGVKGLSEEKLKTAQPNADEVKRLDKQKTSAGDARTFAKQGKLSSQQVNYLSGDKE